MKLIEVNKILARTSILYDSKTSLQTHTSFTSTLNFYYYYAQNVGLDKVLHREFNRFSTVRDVIMKVFTSLSSCWLVPGILVNRNIDWYGLGLKKDVIFQSLRCLDVWEFKSTNDSDIHRHKQIEIIRGVYYALRSIGEVLLGVLGGTIDFWVVQLCLILLDKLCILDALILP